MATRTANAQASPASSRLNMSMARMGMLGLLCVVATSWLHNTYWIGDIPAIPIPGVDGGVIPGTARSPLHPDLTPRADSPTDVCFRWAQQSAVVNGTLYLYGGQATTTSGQTQNTWNNDFLTLDLTQTWQIASPSLTGLPQPSGPPEVALGYLWNSHDSLYLYGGEFSWKPAVSPSAFALWEYSINTQSWSQHTDPQTSSGESAPSNNEPVQRAAEGAGASVPSLGRGFYFGGHLDGYTTPGWSQSVPRQYLQSLLEYTFPGFTNGQVDTLSNNQKAGADGAYRNVTEGGLQSSAGFTERADGLLVYVPGFGDQGILVALAGGTNNSYTQMNVVDVYDIAESAWYKQSTSGAFPDTRVNPCSVVTAAPDGSSYQIYLWGGQALLPYGNQTQFDDMWILSLPSFTWIQVDQSGQSVPYGRSGHSCSVWDAQMISVGGYVGDQLTCESPGVYVFDLSTLQWAQQFNAYSAGSNSASNPLNQQTAQIANGTSSGGLEGSYNYTVPEAVVSVIGGGPSGGATLTAPVITASSGPLATGSAITYSITSAGVTVVTQSGGVVVTETASPSSGTSGSSSSGHNGPNVAAIVVGVICGILFIIVCYLAFCAYIYRKQLQLYKRHNEMSQQQATREKPVPVVAGPFGRSSHGSSEHHGAPQQPLWMNRDSHSQTGSADSNAQQAGPNSGAGVSGAAGGGGYQSVRRSSDHSSTGDLLADHEPSFVGVMLNPRRSLRVINRD